MIPTSLQLLGINDSSVFYIQFPIYQYLFVRYLVLAEHYFSSNILVPFPDLSNLYTVQQSIHTTNPFQQLLPKGEDLPFSRDVKPFCELDVKNFTLFSYESP